MSDPIMNNYEKSVIGWITLKILKTQAKSKKHGMIVKNDMTNDVENIKHTGNDMAHPW